MADSNRDLDLQKIQILESTYQAWFNLVASIFAGGFVGMLILIVTLYYEGPLRNWCLFGLAYLIVIVVLIIGYWRFNEDQKRHLKFITTKMDIVQKGDPLKSLWDERERK
jgi:high-affinity Fe2+/Pb2+ permease